LIRLYYYTFEPNQALRVMTSTALISTAAMPTGIMIFQPMFMSRKRAQPATQKERYRDGRHHEDIGVFGQEIQRPTKTAVLVGAQPHQVARDAVQLGENHANGLRARRGVDVQQFLYGQAIAQTVGNGSHVIQSVYLRIELGVASMLRQFFQAAMRVADDAIRTKYFFPIEF
jgi:hypothetical protein